MAARAKKYTSYIKAPPSWWDASSDDYKYLPAKAFLREVVHISDAITHCRRTFTKTKDRKLTKDSEDSLFRLSASALVAIMGHFETYQRATFAGMFELSAYLSGFNVQESFKSLSGTQISVRAASAYRGQLFSAGQLVTDSLSDWHNPSTVNKYIGEFVPGDFFNKDDRAQLRILWQLRHSIAHTAGWVSLADSQKHPDLVKHAGRPLLLDPSFIPAVARRLHGVVKRSSGGCGKRFIARLSPETPIPANNHAAALFRVESPRSSWL